MNPDNIVGVFETIEASMTSTLSVSAATLVIGAVEVPALSATWGAPTNPYLTGYEFEYQQVGGSGYSHDKAKSTALSWVATNGVLPGADYNVRYRARGTAVFGPWSAWQTITTPSSFIVGGIVGQAPAATDPTIHPGATSNPTFVQAVDPYSGGTVPDGAFWFDTANGLPYLGSAGIWNVFTGLVTGATFSCQDISTKPVSTIIARCPGMIPWRIPSTTTTPLPGLAVGKVGFAPAADTVFDLQLDGGSVGSVKWLAGTTTPLLVKTSASDINPTDYLDLVTPASLNGMSGAFGLGILGVKRG